MLRSKKGSLALYRHQILRKADIEYNRILEGFPDR